jgi:hypothetical protein
MGWAASFPPFPFTFLIMLSLIAAQPVVSSATLHPDHLCKALISEADRLGIVLDRDLWQPAAAIAAHGRKPGAYCLDLPPRLREVSGEIVSGLFDALNWAAPPGCSLITSEGDGALLLWTLTLEAQAEVINTDPTSRWEAKILKVPEQWLSAIVNGDTSGMSDEEEKQFDAFESDELSDGWTVSSWDEEGSFSRYHDAGPYGMLACNVVEVLAMRLKPQA